MQNHQELQERLRSLEGRGYKAYGAIWGSWRYPDFVLEVAHVQGDPFAAPSRIRVHLAPEAAGLPPDSYRSPSRALGTAASLARAFAGAARETSGGAGSGRSGIVRMEGPGQKVMPQTAVQVSRDGAVEARFVVGLPARGRRILGHEAARLLGDVVPALVRGTLAAGAHDSEALERHAAMNEDADHLRGRLMEEDLVAFVADGAVLPRRSGVDDRPLEGDVVPFASPPSLRRTVRLPNSGMVSGMGIPRGVTLIVGGGFHGKSTLLRAVEHGVYNHRPGDGRELVVSRPDAVKIRAEDGRSVAGVDISWFIDGLPLGTATDAFTTPNASGSTSQAAAIVEALEAGSSVLLVDEDTSATNFMIRDRRMQALVPPEREPITPFVDRVAQLREAGVDCVLVVGGSGDYLDVADTVIRLDAYRPADATEEARTVAEAHPTGRLREGRTTPWGSGARRPLAGSLNPRKGPRARHIKVPDARTLLFGDQTLDLAAVEQLVSVGQVRALGHALHFLAEHGVDGGRTVSELLDLFDDAVAEGGLDALDDRRTGDLAWVRRHEVAAALNRLRSLRVH